MLKTLQAQLLTGLLASDKFALYSQSPIRNLLAAIVAYLFPPDSPFSRLIVFLLFLKVLEQLNSPFLEGDKSN